MASRQRRRVLPVVIAVSALATGGAGIVSAGEIREDEREARAAALREVQRAAAAKRAAAAREAELEAAYREELGRIAEEVYDAVTPLQQAYTDLDEGRVSSVDVLIDVGGAEGVPAALVGPQEALEELEVPAALTDEHRGLGEALQALEEAGSTEEMLAAAEGRALGRVIVESDLQLDVASRRWAAAVELVYGGERPVSVASRDGKGGRKPRSRTSFLHQAGTVCLQGLDVVISEDPEREPSLQEVHAAVRELSGRIPKIVAVPTADVEESEVEASIRVHLRRAAEVGAGFRAAERAARGGDEAGLRAAEAQIARSGLAAEKAAAGLRAYGSETCALYLVGSEEGSGDEGTSAA